MIKEDIEKNILNSFKKVMKDEVKELDLMVSVDWFEWNNC